MDLHSSFETEETHRLWGFFVWLKTRIRWIRRTERAEMDGQVA